MKDIEEKLEKARNYIRKVENSLQQRQIELNQDKRHLNVVSNIIIGLSRDAERGESTTFSPPILSNEFKNKIANRLRRKNK